MRYIRKIFRQDNAIYLVIAICTLADLFFFYSKGLSREASANFAYLDYIKNFPASISSVRVEPFFVVLSFYLSKIIGSSILSIAILKNVIIPVQLFIFYKITKLLVKNNTLALFSVIFLNFSFAYISMVDNLLRNNLANLFMLICVYFIFKLFQSGKISKSEIAACCLSGGALIYTHILPSIILDFTLASSTLLLILIIILAKFNFPKIRFENIPRGKELLKKLILISSIIFALQLPYILRLVTNARLDDYKNNSAYVQTPSVTPSVNISTITSSCTKVFRILFEYRLPGFSIFFIFLSFLSILFLLKNIKIISSKIPLLILFLLAYFGSRADLIFGIGTIPYRFSLILIFPALLALFVLLDYLLEKIRNKQGKLLLILVFTISFVGMNFPIIAEATILKNANNATLKIDDLRAMYHQFSINEEGNIFMINGDSLEETGSSSIYIRNSNIFSTTNTEQIVQFMKDNSVNYVLFDNNRINKTGNDIGSTINTNLGAFEKSPYFTELGEYIGNTGTDLTIFKFNPDGNIARINPENTTFNCSNDKLCADNFTQKIAESSSSISSWHINIDHDDNLINIKEYAELSNGSIFELNYQDISTSNDSFSRGATIKLKAVSYRKTIHPIINIRIGAGLVLWQSTNIDLNYVNLEKLSIDNLTVSGTTNSNTISYSAITRKGYVGLIHIIAFLLILITYIFFLIHQKISACKIDLFEFISRKTAILIIVLLFMLFVDLLGGSMLFFEIYKKIIGI